MAKRERKTAAAGTAATTAVAKTTGRGSNPASRANLAKGGGKKGRSGRKPRAFELLCQQLLDEDAEVQGEFELALKDRFTKGYTGNVKLAAQLAGKLKTEAAPLAGPQFVIVVPAIPGAVEDWMQRFAPPEAIEEAARVGQGRDLSRVEPADIGLAIPEE